MIVLVATVAFVITKVAPCAFASSRAPTDGILATAERWLEVVEPAPHVRGILSDGSGNEGIRLSVRNIASDGSAAPAVSVERIAIHDELFRGIAPALDDGGRVFLALESTGLVRETVSYVVVRRPDGSYEFLAGCSIDLTAEVRGLLGSRYDEAIPRLIGMTDPDAIYRLLAGVSEAPGHVLVEHTRAGPDLRTFTRTGTLIERGRCLALVTDVGPLVPIWDDHHFLAVDEEGLVVMSGSNPMTRPGDTLEFGGRELSPDEALAYTDRASIRRCPGRLILLGNISVTLLTPPP